MERKFMVYQRRDGFQIAEEATGTRMENGMDFLARPHKSANWCAAVFNIVIDDDYELVGEEVIDFSIEPTKAICFIDGVMKPYGFIAFKAITEGLSDEQALSYFSQQSFDRLSGEEKAMAKTRDHVEALKLNEEKNYHDAIADFTWELQLETSDGFFAMMDEALKMNLELDEEFFSIDTLAPSDDSKAIFKSIASKNIVGCVMGICKAHAEALEMNNAQKSAY
ncbi:hypothetical protein NXA99_07490 [Citrobacter amalonaticus]|uniref:hypothetical protein n=1 Tax=Citrobacter amalonaticus TaxID=35703 RepID=UPI00215C6D53|nr:hypothetical protein [Citrobacter amalonaticus]MCR9028376.1 hypothetical protein [Citrobacter amalonaticus]